MIGFVWSLTSLQNSFLGRFMIDICWLFMVVGDFVLETNCDFCDRLQEVFW